ncbi:MAG: hypothetical protein ACPGSC_01150 [Granulosicoccaceae bacterium]
MKKLDKKRAAEAADVSLYKIYQDISSGRMNALTSSSMCFEPLRQSCAIGVQVPENQNSCEVLFSASESSELMHAGNRQRSLIGKLEALLSLAERHRLMIEQQRRNISALKKLNHRQECELERLRKKMGDLQHAKIQPWRRLFALISGIRRAS